MAPLQYSCHWRPQVGPPNSSPSVAWLYLHFNINHNDLSLPANNSLSIPGFHPCNCMAGHILVLNKDQQLLHLLYHNGSISWQKSSLGVMGSQEHPHVQRFPVVHGLIILLYYSNTVRIQRKRLQGESRGIHCFLVLSPSRNQSEFTLSTQRRQCSNTCTTFPHRKAH